MQTDVHRVRAPLLERSEGARSLPSYVYADSPLRAKGG